MTDFDENAPPPLSQDDEGMEEEEDDEAGEYPVIPPKFTHAPDTDIGALQREIGTLEQEVDQANTINIDLMMVDLQQGSEHIKYSEAELEQIATPEEILKIHEILRTQGIAIAYDYLFATFMSGGTHARNATAGISRIRHTMGSIQKKMQYGKFINTTEGNERMGVE